MNKDLSIGNFKKKFEVEMKMVQVDTLGDGTDC